MSLSIWLFLYVSLNIDALEAPLFSTAQQQWIQQMIAAQTTRRSDCDAPETATPISSTLPETSTSTMLTTLSLIASTVWNVGE